MRKTVTSAFAAAMLVLLGAGCAPATPAQPPAPPLTRADALVVLRDEVQDCEEAGVEGRYRSCTVTIVASGDAYLVTVTHDGFFDDSVKASRVEATITRRDGIWVKGEVVETYQCWPNRGHQEFSSELCV